MGLQRAFLLYRDNWFNCLTEQGDLVSHTWMTVATCWEKMSNSLISAGMPGPSSRWANRASLKNERAKRKFSYCSRQMSSHTDGTASEATCSFYFHLLASLQWITKKNLQGLQIRYKHSILKVTHFNYLLILIWPDFSLEWLLSLLLLLGLLQKSKGYCPQNIISYSIRFYAYVVSPKKKVSAIS